MNKKQDLYKIQLSSEEKRKMLDEIKDYYEREREEQIGIIASEGLLDFFLEDLGKIIYNKALDDVKRWYQTRMDDVEADFYTIYK
jgi:uncharacterized protein (DUF2164 family)